MLNDRIRLINKINADIADWLQVRRPVPCTHSGAVRMPELTLMALVIGTAASRGGVRPRPAEACASTATGQWSTIGVSQGVDTR